MSAELDMSQYIDLFLQEADEQLEILEQETLKLEEAPTSDRLQLIFRAAHTLKGSSRAMGLVKFAELTHEMENILDLLRGGQLQVTTDCANALLACIDMLAEMKESVADGKGDGDVDPSFLVARLVQISAGSGTQPEVEADPAPTGVCQIPSDYWEALAQAAQSGPVHHLKVALSPDCVMKFVRTFMVISAIQEEGEILVAAPNLEDLEEEKFDLHFEMVFQTNADPRAVLEKIQGISELASAEITPWQEPTVMAAQPATTAPTVPAPAPSAGPTATSAPAKKTDTGQTVRVDVSRLDSLMNLVGELVIDRTRISQVAHELSMKLDGSEVEALAETVSHIARITTDLQDQIMKTRMMPIEVVFNRFPRVVRDLAQKLDKDIRLELVGGDTELDRSVIEVIGDPLLHIIRNSLDHGVELPDDREAAGKPRQGTVTVSARHQENHIVIDIIDDGRGIDPAKIKGKAVEKGELTADQAAKMSDRDALMLIFGSGFSTAQEVSEVSGRGVGMDIVRSNIQRLGGLIEMDSTVGKGTTFTLRLPLTLAIIRGLLVRVDGNVYVLPLGSVVETMLLEESTIQKVNRRDVVVIRGSTTPLIRLRDFFKVEKESADSELKDGRIVIVGVADQKVGLVVDQLIGEQEVVIKSLSRFCGDIRGISGATILGDGNVALIVDVSSVLTAERGQIK